MSGFGRILFFFIGIGCIVLLLLKNFPEAMDNSNNQLSLVSTLAILSFLILRLANSSLGISSILKQISVWIIIIFIILAGYSYKHELQGVSDQVLANLLPGYGKMSADDQSMIFYAGDNGHFTIAATLNDQAKVNFMLDTGASTVSLTYKDAIALGIDLNSLNYNIPFNTANGMSWGAKYMIDKIQIGSIIVYDVPANISKEGSLDTSLLGMSFLNRLSSFNIKANQLTLSK